MAMVRSWISTFIIFFLVGEEDRHRHDQMQAAVAVFLRIGDVVLAADQRDVVLLHERVGDAIDIVHKGADHAHTGDVEEVFFNGGCAESEAAARQLVADARRLLEAALDAFDRIALVLVGKIFVDDVEFCLDLHDGAAVVGHQPLEIVDLAADVADKLFRRETFVVEVAF